jgi:hypothetical protein
MAGKADFTEDEWKGLAKGVTGAGMLVSLAHKDFTDSFGEATALAKDRSGHDCELENPYQIRIGGAVTVNTRVGCGGGNRNRAICFFGFLFNYFFDFLCVRVWSVH